MGVAIMIVAVAILTGFQEEIRDKVTGFSGHIQVTRFQENPGLEIPPMDGNPAFLPRLRKMKGIRHVQAFAVKAGIIKASGHIQGVILKGVGPDYDWRFFRERLVAGHTLSLRDTIRTNDVLISKKTADMLDLRLNGDLRMYFINGGQALGRKFHIAGIYDTGLEEFDKLYVIGDIGHIRKLGNWEPGQVGGLEIFIDRFRDIDRMGVQVYRMAGYEYDAATIKMLNQQIFDWLDLQDVNVVIILVLLIVVSATTIISALLILILEKTSLIGILKALGMTSGAVRRLFLYQALRIVGWGLLWGNVAGISLCLLQEKFAVVKLRQETYYMSVIPVNLDLWNILLVDAGTVAVCYLIFLLPSLVIARVSPVRAIRYA